jgi:hypothetical protein
MPRHLTLFLAATATLGDTTENAIVFPASDGARMMPMMRGMMAADHVERRISYQKAELAITDAQLNAWNAVAAALRLNAKAVQDGMATMARSDMPTTAPTQSDMMVMLMSERLDGTKKPSAANNALYAFLTPDQWKTANDRPTCPMGMI